MAVLGVGALVAVLRLVKGRGQNEQPVTAPADKVAIVPDKQGAPSKTPSAAALEATSWPIFGE
jgi:hypothetical protein